MTGPKSLCAHRFDKGLGFVISKFKYYFIKTVFNLLALL